MSARELNEMAQRAAALTADEKLQLAAMLIEQARQGQEATVPPVRWRDLRGQVPEPALGEDAQAWVTRTRQEGAERERR